MNEAIDCFDQDIKLNPENAAAYNNKGNALSYLDKKFEKNQRMG
jgi:tetratricopeptide (TPR) repeat protein